jgi:hypothetical protein
MIALDEPSSWSRLEKPAGTSDEIPESDDDYEDALVGLLGRLEHLREGILAAQAAGRPAQVLQLAQELMDLATTFSERYCAFAAVRELDEAGSRRSDFFAALGPLRGQFQGSGVRSLLNSGSRSGSDATATQTLARRCLTALHEALFAYFVIFTSRFSTSRAARQWVEVAAMFVVEMKRLAQDPLPNLPRTD